MKKISILLLVLTCTALLSGCSNGEKVVGSEAAKLLLANERLESEKLKKVNIDILNTNTPKKAKRMSRINLNAKKINSRKGKSEIGSKVNKDGNTYTWTDFGEYSNDISYFESFVKSIEQQTNEAGKIIDSAKSKIDSNDVWVKSLMYQELLNVSSNEDVVIRRNNNYYQIVKRTTNTEGEEIYDSFQAELDKTYGTRVRKLSDYRYEYSHISEENDFEHFFIADKSRGYWIAQSPFNEREFSTTVIKDDMCYEFTVDMEDNNISTLQVLTPDQKYDVVNIIGDSFEFYAGAFTNIKSMSMTTTEDKVINLSDYDYSGTDYHLLYDDSTKQYYTTGNKSADVNIDGGLTLKVGDKFVNGNVEVTRGLVAGLADGMYGEFSIDVKGNTLKEKIDNVKGFINETGLKFVRDQESVLKSIELAYADAQTAVHSIVWNNNLLDSVEKYGDSRNLEKEKLLSFNNLFSEVKDNTVLSRNQQGSLDRKTKFPYIVKSSFVADYKENIVTIQNTSAKVNDFTLFENGKEYKLQFALAEYSEEEQGYFDLIPIETTNPFTTAYNGQEEFSVTASNLEFVIPIVSEGQYELVTYISDDEGIRVTRPQPVKFNSIESNSVDVHNITIEINKTDEELLNVTSRINNNVVLQIENPKQTYSYTELYKLLTTEAYKYGIVTSTEIEKLNNDNSWSKVNSTDQALSNGTYRIEFSNSVNEKVYVTTSY